MDDFVKDFFSQLHREYLKELGYQKVRHTFSRDKGTHWERFQFQGSAWNRPGFAWRFYINVGVVFKDLPPPKYAYGYFGDVHCGDRIEGILPDVPREYDLVPGNARGVMRVLVENIERASREMTSHLSKVRSNYVNTKSAGLRIA